MNRNNRNDYEPNIYGSNNQENQSRGYYQSDGQQSKSNYVPNTNKSDGQQNQNNKKLSGCISVIFVLWFFGTIALAVFLSAKKLDGFCLATFGQAFLVFGIIGFLKVENVLWKALPSIFILAGISIIIGGVATQAGLKKEVLHLLPLAISVFLSLVGIFIISVSIFSTNKKSKICTQKVDAVISELRFTYQRGSKGRMLKLEAPVYKYEYNGLTYTHYSNEYSNVGVKPVGTRLELYINPLNPEEIYIKSVGNMVFGIAIGVFVLLIGICVLGVAF